MRITDSRLMPALTLAVLLGLLSSTLAYDNIDRLVDELLALSPGARRWLRAAAGPARALAGRRGRAQSRFINMDSSGASSLLGLGGSSLLGGLGGSGAGDDAAAQAASLVQRISSMDRLECVPRMLCSAAAGALEPSPPTPASGQQQFGAASPAQQQQPLTSHLGQQRPGQQRPGQQRPFDVFNPAASQFQQRRLQRTERRRQHHRQKRFTQTVNNFLSVLDGMARPYSFYPYSHALLMGGMTESRDRCAQLYSRCPTDRRGLLDVMNNMNRYFPGGLQSMLPADLLPNLQMPSLDTLLGR